MASGAPASQAVKLPAGALQGGRATFAVPPLASPSASSMALPARMPAYSPTALGHPIVTPVNAASTQWRTVTCPNPPQKRGFGRTRTLSADATPGSSGLRTPANLWPTPEGATLGAAPRSFSMGQRGRTTSSSSSAEDAASQGGSVSAGSHPGVALSPIHASRARSASPASGSPLAMETPSPGLKHPAGSLQRLETPAKEPMAAALQRGAAASAGEPGK